MLCVVLFILNLTLFVRLTHAENPVDFRINVSKLEYNFGYDVPDKLMPIVVQNQPLNIILMNYNKTVKGVTCLRKSEDYPFVTNFMTAYIENTPCLIIKVKLITKDMSTKWQCIVKEKQTTLQDTINFRIHVKEGKSLYMTINGEQFPHTPTSLSVTDHDGFGTYWFEPGEAIFINCSEPDGNALLDLRYISAGEGVLHTFSNPKKIPEKFEAWVRVVCGTDECDFNYKEKRVCDRHFTERDRNRNNRLNVLAVPSLFLRGTKVIQSKNILSNPVFFSTIMTENNDNDIVDCSYIKIKDEMKYTYRTMFQRSFITSPDSSLEISVNSLKLVQTKKEKDEYQYKFYDDEEIEVICEKKDMNATGNLFFGQNDKPLIQSRELKVFNDTLWRKRIKCKAKHFQNKHLLCYIDKAKNKKADILFIPETKEPHISGLSPSDLQYQYSDSNTTWVAHYWYSPSQTINLTCTTKHEDAALTITINNTIVNQRRKAKHINHQMILNDTYDGIPIACFNNKEQNPMQRGIIYLHKKPDIPDDHRNGNEQLLILGGAVAGVLLTFVVIGVICWCRAKRRNNTNIPYKNETKDLKILKTDCTRRENHPENVNNSDFMLENSLYNGALYAIPKKKDDVPEYHYIDVDDEIIKKQKEFRDNIAEQRAKKNVRNEGIDNVEYAQPYANSSKAEFLAVNNKNPDLVDYVEPAYCEINRR